MNQYEYDFFVIGGGSGGVRAARWAAAKGLKVGMAEGARLGGTCVNVGCVPKKLYFHAANLSTTIDYAAGFGWTIPSTMSHDWTALKTGIDKYIHRLNGIYAGMLDRVGVTRHQAWARMITEHNIELRSGENITTVSAAHILLAPGSTPHLPTLEGVELASTSDDFFALSDRPRSAAVIGGGYIGVEMAGILAGLGVETTLAYRSDLPLRSFDQDVRTRLDRSLRAQVTVRSEAILQKLVGEENGLKQVYLSDSQSPIEAEFVLLATGRKPNTAPLNLESVGVELSPKRKAVIVDDEYRTNIPHIFAVGDVIDRMQLTPVALAEGMRVVHQIIGDPLPPLDYALVPTTVFSHPNLGTVGLSEEQARDRGRSIKVYEADFKPLQQALQALPQRVYMKMIVDLESDKVIGCHMIGDEAGEQIQGLAVAMQAGVTKSQLDQTIGIHPTMAEEWVTMRTCRKS